MVGHTRLATPIKKESSKPTRSSVRLRRKKKGLDWHDLLSDKPYLGESHLAHGDPYRLSNYIYRYCVECRCERFDEEEWQTIKEYGGRAGMDMFFCSDQCTRRFLGPEVMDRELRGMYSFMKSEYEYGVQRSRR